MICVEALWVWGGNFLRFCPRPKAALTHSTVGEHLLNSSKGNKPVLCWRAFFLVVFCGVKLLSPSVFNTPRVSWSCRPGCAQFQVLGLQPSLAHLCIAGHDQCTAIKYLWHLWDSLEDCGVFVTGLINEQNLFTLCNSVKLNLKRSLIPVDLEVLLKTWMLL